MDSTTSPVPGADPRNPAQKYYSGVAAMALAVASLFILTPLLAVAAIVCGIVAVVSGGKLDNARLRGEGWFGIVIAGLVLSLYALVF